MSSKIILFISHNASQTGAPIIFLNFLRWFKEHIDIPFKIILREDGLLRQEFEKLAPTIVYELPPKNLLQRILTQLGLRNSSRHVRKYLSNNNIGLIYSNTVTNHKVLSELEFLKCPVISHVHELEYVIRVMAGDQFLVTKSLTNHYIAVSDAVRENLLKQHEIPASQISRLYGSIPIANLAYESALNEREKTRTQLGISADTFVVGASGSICWRKGSDLFIQLAHIFRQKYPGIPILFLWIGGDQGQYVEYIEVQHDICQLDLEQNVRFLGSKPSPLDYFATFDVFTLLSREDPYPLVCLEVALLGNPIVCFDGAGGAKEFVENDCGFVVPYMDIDAAAEKIHLLFNSLELRKRLGEKASEKVKIRHDMENTAEALAHLIQEFIV